MKNFFYLILALSATAHAVETPQEAPKKAETKKPVDENANTQAAEDAQGPASSCPLTK